VTVRRSRLSRVSVSALSARTEGNAGDHDCCHACGQPLGSAGVDWLTRLPDRWRWESEAPRALAEAEGCGALAMVDLDRFKAINDEIGHIAGDAVLQAAAQVLRQVACPTGVLARYGGDEYLLLMPAADTADATAVAETICSGVRALSVVVATPRGRAEVTDVTASVGVACMSRGQAGSIQDLVMVADLALREAKYRGGNQVLWNYAPDRTSQ
jgi:diguanylate cyclase (GGDEF)-like protein